MRRRWDHELSLVLATQVLSEQPLAALLSLSTLFGYFQFYFLLEIFVREAWLLAALQSSQDQAGMAHLETGREMGYRLPPQSFLLRLSALCV